MVDNATSKQHDSEESDDTWDWSLSDTQQLIINYIVLVLTLSTLIYGITSWCILRKFRNYRNFVFLNAILSNFINDTSNKVIHFYFIWFGVETYLFYGLIFLSHCCHTARAHWLLVISHLFSTIK